MLYQAGEILRFHEGYRGGKYLGEGWHAAEPHHCWSSELTARVRIRFRQLSDNDLTLRVKAAAFVTAEMRQHKVRASVNGVHLAAWHVTGLAWHEATIPSGLMDDGFVNIDFMTDGLSPPSASGVSVDDRKLGIDLHSLVIFDNPDLSSSSVRMIGAGHDPIGDVFLSSASYHRAIRKSDSLAFETLQRLGVYQELANKKLIPEQYVRTISSAKYSHIVSQATGRTVSPAKYPWHMVRDAAHNWIAINQSLLADERVRDYGLCDGHYGNFVQCDNAVPKWCDIGSISSAQNGLAFGYGEFVRCFVVPLVMASISPNAPINVRQTMAKNPGGISIELAKRLCGVELEWPGVEEAYAPGTRSQALARLRQLIESITVGDSKGYWSDYRSAEALDLAWSGKLMSGEYDSRFKAVVDTVARSEATSFIDIGCNDGIFSLLCALAGLKGIAYDIDEFAINKLYAFLRTHPQAEVSVAFGGFLDIEGQADIVLALALTHHLVISQRMTFDQVAERLHRLAVKAVITEFMEDGLGGTPAHPAPSPDPLPAGYDIESFLKALRRHFERVEIVSYARDANAAYFSRRTLIYCEEPF